MEMKFFQNSKCLFMSVVGKFVACNQHLAGLRGVRVNGEGWSPGGVEGQLLDGIWESLQPCSFFY